MLESFSGSEKQRSMSPSELGAEYLEEKTATEEHKSRLERIKVAKSLTLLFSGGFAAATTAAEFTHNIEPGFDFPLTLTVYSLGFLAYQQLGKAEQLSKETSKIREKQEASDYARQLRVREEMGEALNDADTAILRTDRAKVQLATESIDRNPNYNSWKVGQEKTREGGQNAE